MVLPDNLHGAADRNRAGDLLITKRPRPITSNTQQNTTTTNSMGWHSTHVVSSCELLPLFVRECPKSDNPFVILLRLPGGEMSHPGIPIKVVPVFKTAD
jgi:hypothetical protein